MIVCRCDASTLFFLAISFRAKNSSRASQRLSLFSLFGLLLLLSPTALLLCTAVAVHLLAHSSLSALAICGCVHRRRHSDGDASIASTARPDEMAVGANRHRCSVVCLHALNDRARTTRCHGDATVCLRPTTATARLGDDESLAANFDTLPNPLVCGGWLSQHHCHWTTVRLDCH